MEIIDISYLSKWENINEMNLGDLEAEVRNVVLSQAEVKKTGASSTDAIVGLFMQLK